MTRKPATATGQANEARAASRNPRTPWRVKFQNLLPAARYAIAELRHSHAPAMAANLAFRTLFGLLPVLVVATIVTRALLGERFIELVTTAIEALGLHTITMRPSDGGDAEPVPLGTWLESLAREAAAVDLSAIGLVGALAVVFSAVWTMVAIETSFNAICRAPAGRPFLRRILVYWFVITAGPVLFAAIPALLGAFTSFVGTDSLPAQLAAQTVSVAGAFLSLWALLTAAYATVPNSRVDLRSAIVGAFVATILVELGKQFLGASLAGTFSANRLYGSLGLVPLFMMWVYLMWLVVLFGLQTASILQGLSQGGRALLVSTARGDSFEPAQAIPCFRAICQRFRKGLGASPHTLVYECGVSPSTARELLAIFERLGLAHRIDGDEKRYAPSRPPEEIELRDVLHAGFALVDGGEETTPEKSVAELRATQLEKLGDTRVTANGTPAGNGQRPG
jgi:membrane protein